FPIVNAFQPQRGSTYYNDAFVAKVSPQGALIYSSYLGGLYTDEGHGIAVDASGNAYVTGVTNSENFPITPGAFQPEIRGGGCSNTFQCPDAFVVKIAEPPSLPPPPPPANGTEFGDVPPGHFARSLIASLVAAGVTAGCQA